MTAVDGAVECACAVDIYGILDAYPDGVGVDLLLADFSRPMMVLGASVALILKLQTVVLV